MSIHQFLEIRGDTCYFRPCGKSSLVEAVDLISCSIASCRARKIQKLLVNATGLTGISAPTLVDRFLMIEAWALEAKGVVMVALVIQPEYIEPRKFGSKVAEHLGWMAEVFSSEMDALEWLSSGVAGLAFGSGDGR